MRTPASVLALVALTACGAPNDRTAAIQQENAAARDAAQESRIINPGALACVRANASDEEWAIIETETSAAETMLANVLRREGTQRCFAINNVVVFM